MIDSKVTTETEMSGLDEFYPDLASTDTKKKLTVGGNIINYLKDEDNPLDCEDIGGFIDGLVPWMQSSNFKVIPVVKTTSQIILFPTTLFDNSRPEVSVSIL